MKKIIYGIPALAIFLSACAASANVPEFHMKSIDEIRQESKSMDFSYKNLDLSEASISIPDTNRIDSVVFPISTDQVEPQVERMEANIRKYEGDEAPENFTDYLTLMYWDFEANDRLEVPYDEATEEQKEVVQYLGYNDGKVSELLVFSNFMLEMGDYSVSAKLAGDTTNYSERAYGYRAWDLGNFQDRYFIGTDDIEGISYHLADGDMLISDAVAYVEEHVKSDYYYVGSPLLDYHVTTVEVRKLQDNLYYYQFNLRASFNGVLMAKDGGLSGWADETEEKSDKPFAVIHHVSVFEKDKLGFIWSSAHSYEEEKILSENSEFISIEDACGQLSRLLSSEKVFKVSDISLMYETDFQYKNKEAEEEGRIYQIYAHPAYQISIPDPGVIDVKSAYYQVDALTGEIAVFYIY